MAKIRLKPPEGLAPYRNFRLASGLGAFPGAQGIVTVDLESDAIDLEREGWLRTTDTQDDQHPTLNAMADRCSTKLAAAYNASARLSDRLAKGELAKGAGVESDLDSWCRASSAFGEALCDLRRTLQEFADTPLPMGTSSVTVRLSDGR